MLVELNNGSGGLTDTDTQFLLVLAVMAKIVVVAGTNLEFLKKVLFSPSSLFFPPNQNSPMATIEFITWPKTLTYKVLMESSCLVVAC